MNAFVSFKHGKSSYLKSSEVSPILHPHNQMKISAPFPVTKYSAKITGHIISD